MERTTSGGGAFGHRPKKEEISGEDRGRTDGRRDSYGLDVSSYSGTDLCAATLSEGISRALNPDLSDRRHVCGDTSTTSKVEHPNSELPPGFSPKRTTTPQSGTTGIAHDDSGAHRFYPFPSVLVPFGSTDPEWPIRGWTGIGGPSFRWDPDEPSRMGNGYGTAHLPGRPDGGHGRIRTEPTTRRTTTNVAPREPRRDAPGRRIPWRERRSPRRNAGRRPSRRSSWRRRSPSRRIRSATRRPTGRTSRWSPRRRRSTPRARTPGPEPQYSSSASVPKL